MRLWKGGPPPRPPRGRAAGGPRAATKLVRGRRLEEAAIKSFRNLTAVHLITFDQLNTYDVLRSDAVVFTRDSLDAFCGRSTTDQPDEELVLEEGDAK